MSAIQPKLHLAYAGPKAQVAPVLYSRNWALALVVFDITMFLLSAYLAGGIVEQHWASSAFFDDLAHSSVYFILIWLLIFERVGLYRRSFALSVKDEFYYTIAALVLGVLPQLVLFTIYPSIRESRLMVLLSVALAVALVGGSRALMHAARNAIARTRPRRIAIVGTGDRIAAVAEALNIVDGTQVLRLEVQNVDSTISAMDLSTDATLDSIDWFRLAKQWGSDTLLLTEMLPPHVMPHLLEVSAQQHIAVAFAPPRVRAHAYSLSMRTDGQQALIVPSQLRACTPSARLLKRLLDLSITIPLTIVLLPIMGLTAAAVWLESRGPVLFRQERVGRGGRVFNMLKFRSMKPDAEASTGPVWASVGDGRTTRVGAFIRRTSLDELPQLFNVLRGQMSIVGPRPERPYFVSEFRRLLPRYDERHLVRPGITGWSQVNMRRVLEPTAAGEKLSYDLFYVEHWSLFMDLSVILKTGLEFLFHRAG